MNTKNTFKLIMVLLAIALYIFLFFIYLPDRQTLILYLILYLIFGFRVIKDGVKKAISGDLFSENTLMTIATLGAFFIGEYPEAVAVMLFFRIGEYLEDYAIDKSKASINQLINIRPETINLFDGYNVILTKAETAKIGDLFIVRPGERVALDGIVTDGMSSIDTSALTGESLPKYIEPGNEILAGTINLDGVIKVRSTKLFTESFAAKIIDLVENSKKNKAKADHLISKFSRIYTPIVVLLAVLLTIIPTFIFGFDSFNEWLRRSLIFLVISCPCALVVSVPLAFFAGIGRASQKGILLKGSITIENLSEAVNFAFDKTGTLTKGIFEVTNIETNNIKESELLDLAAHAEANSNHPIAKSIVAANKHINLSRVTDVIEVAGRGIIAKVDNKTVSVGNKKLIPELNLNHHNYRTGVYVIVDGVYKGFIEVADSIKADAVDAITAVSALNIKSISILSGDDKTPVEKLARQLKITSVFSRLLPQDKVENVKELCKEGITVFVGDGINDAPVLIEADVGIAMGAIGSDAAIEAADVVILDDDLKKIPEAIKLSRRTLFRAKQNIVFALGVKTIILLLGALGLTSMWLAVIADVGVTLAAVANSIRK
ncbi:MAG: cadmium-translocating P-type ATPase [Clostridiales bacterium GWF2_38_85]|nr:MAG: cadmium-translocating P-type ATPase [Clostridiales bacterium GWF2_38_85]HBL85269.1 cadmium-translocating P-type ATPase [Clostridiales bacterium]